MIVRGIRKCRSLESDERKLKRIARMKQAHSSPIKSVGLVHKSWIFYYRFKALSEFLPFEFFTWSNTFFLFNVAQVSNLRDID